MKEKIKQHINELENILINSENTTDAEILNREFYNKIQNDYIPFSFNGRSEDNFKLLNSLKRVIPPIKNMNSHKGSIYITFLSDIDPIVFSGETTAEIIEKLVNLKNSEGKINGTRK